MLKIEEFHQEFTQSILIGADVRGLMKSEVFLEETNNFKLQLFQYIQSVVKN